MCCGIYVKQQVKKGVCTTIKVHLRNNSSKVSQELYACSFLGLPGKTVERLSQEEITNYQ